MTRVNQWESWQRRWPFLRDVLLFVVGVAGVAWETLHGPVNPSLLVLFGGCLGLPAVLRKDEK